MSDILSTRGVGFFCLTSRTCRLTLGLMRTQVTQAEIAIEALKLGAGLYTIAKWRDRGIPASWRWRLASKFPARVLDSFASLPEKAAS
jgi:hypothetical protein